MKPTSQAADQAPSSGGQPHGAAPPSHLREIFEKMEGMISFEEGCLLYQLARAVRGRCIVEVGSYRGRSTAMLAHGSMDGQSVPVYAIEPHEVFTGVLGGKFGPEDRGAFFRAMVETASYPVVRLVNLSSEQVAPAWDKLIGLLWLDGDHAYAGVKRDFECWLPHLAPDAIVAFHDSTDPKLGPRQVINEAVASGRFQELYQVNAATILGQKPL